MSQYQDILNQIEALRKRAEEVRKQEVADKIKEVRDLMARYQLSAEDVVGKAVKGAKKARAAVEAKFRDPETGKTWTGRGKPPLWILGKARDAFKIQG